GLSSPVCLPHCPSFPTRRSSDLTVGATGCSSVTGCRCRSGTLSIGGSTMWASRQHRARIGVVGNSRQYKLYGDDLTNYVQYVGRSEEHTSELQSHLNLVCRLLLE